MVTATQHPLVELLPWDTEFFGRRIARAKIGRLDPSSAARLVGEATEAGVECLYFAADAEDFATVLAAEERGFHLVDVRVVLERPAGVAPATPEEAEFTIDAPGTADLPRLEEIATQIGRLSRYAADPRFSREDCERLYRVWIRNACNGYADAILVARDHPGGVPLGFVGTKMHDALCDLQLVGVALEQRQRRVGRALVGAGIAWAQQHGATRLQVVTQGRNVAAQRLYQQLGFLTTEVKLFYHLWLPRTAR